MRGRDLKICIVSSAGGHLSEALKATDGLDYERYYVTYYTDSLQRFAEDNRVYFITHPRHCFFLLRILLFLKNSIESIFILLKENPDLIISTGADVAVATCIAGKLLGKKLIYIESGGYVTTKSLSGRLIYHFADLFIVQWEAGIKNFPGAIYGGPLF